MHKRELSNRKDIKTLVISFYEKVKVDPDLGPFFNSTIKNWDEHYDILTDFWEQQLLGAKSYLRNPIVAHQEVDKKSNYKITNAHFGMWLNLWFATLDELFEGDVVWIAKNRAQKMSTMLFLKLFEARKT
ncbi:group III truncated hemoglobin [Eudoraea chungangensis]|uniref:group III truncated hemoglobin n=1 Tax=Eudoraea chungangensis TaxID=1481905 RepID=UPI0023EC5E8D|nr:group III truncated hemoglobin [Eudoraea chungangensis]